MVSRRSLLGRYEYGYMDVCKKGVRIALVED